MGKFIIHGGEPLSGEVNVSGSKNAALPIIFASLLTRGVSKIHGLPDISDVNTALEIISGFGASVVRDAGVTYIDTRVLSYQRPKERSVSCLRASTYLIGACLGRFGMAEIQSFGGCNFSHRPIDMHLSAAESFGAEVSGDFVRADRLVGAEISFRQKSVGATVNAILMAVSAEGESVLRGCAVEPHIMTLISYLKSAGAEVLAEGDVFKIRGASLKGGNVYIPGDMIEAATYLSLSALMRGRISVGGFDISELGSFLKHLSYSGADHKSCADKIGIIGLPKRRCDIVTEAYPGFPTDMQPIFSVLLALGAGGSIRETVWEGRFGYLSELAKLGVRYSLSDRGAVIYPSVPIAASVYATDLRGGAAAILLALSALGTSEINNGEYVLRGYERIVEKLTALGAQISYEY